MNREEKRVYKRRYNAVQRAARKMVANDAHEIVTSAAKSELARARQEALDEAMNQAMLLTLVLPAKVMMDIYWPKSYAKKVPEFVNHVLEYYGRWQNGEWDIDELRKELWEVGGVKIVEEGDTSENE